MEKPTLLLVDAIAGVPARWLREMETVDTCVVSSGADALGWLDSRRFDAVVASHRSEPPSGIELLTEVAHIQPQAQRVLMSPYSELQGLPEAMGQGSVTGFLPMPVDPRQLRALVGQIGRPPGGHAEPRIEAVVLGGRELLEHLDEILAAEGVGTTRNERGDGADVLLCEAAVTAELISAARRMARASLLSRREPPLVEAGNHLVVLPPVRRDDDGDTGGLRDLVSEFERRVISEMLARHGGNRTRTAKALGMTRQGLALKLKKLGS
ncbi:helix-turn-helix domain-containing protein [Haliangium sp.]|uniref:helix-turn-helix domain-containing protein n=1 Tax=Haliangium sp. TaxID=2663208 RepID=UPI003D0DEFBF